MKYILGIQNLLFICTWLISFGVEHRVLPRRLCHILICGTYIQVYESIRTVVVSSAIHRMCHIRRTYCWYRKSLGPRLRMVHPQNFYIIQEDEKMIY